MEQKNIKARPIFTALLIAIVFFIITFFIFPADFYPTTGRALRYLILPKNISEVSNQLVLDTLKVNLPWVYLSPWVPMSFVQQCDGFGCLFMLLYYPFIFVFLFSLYLWLILEAVQNIQEKNYANFRKLLKILFIIWLGAIVIGMFYIRIKVFEVRYNYLKKIARLEKFVFRNNFSSREFNTATKGYQESLSDNPT